MRGRASRAVPIVAFLAGLVAGCEPTAAGTPVGCPLLSIEGVLEPLGAAGSIGIRSGERHLVITWANGFGSATVAGRLVVVGPDDAVVGREGDFVELSGREIRPGEWLGCAPPILVSPPP